MEGILSYEELSMNNSKIGVARCIQNQYMHYLKDNFDRNQKNTAIIVTMCVEDSWKWMNEIGIKAVQNNEYLLNEINLLKSIQARHKSEHSQWEQFCIELEKSNTNLKNENSDLQNTIKNVNQFHDTMFDEYKHFKQTNGTLLNKLENCEKQCSKTQDEIKEFQQQISSLNENINYLKREKDSITRQHNITINDLHSKHEQNINEMEIIINNLLREKRQYFEFETHSKVNEHGMENKKSALDAYDYEKGETVSPQFIDMDVENGEESELSDEDLEMSGFYEYNNNVEDESDAFYEYKYEICKLFVKYKLMNESDTEVMEMVDSKLSLQIIENICKNADKYKNAYFSANKKIQTLRRSKSKLKHRLDSLKIHKQQNKRNKPKLKRRVRIKRKNAVAIDPRPYPMDILSAICEDLLSLMKYLQIVQNNNQYEYCLNKVRSLSLSLKHSAKHTASPLLQNAVNILHLLRNKMYKHSNLYRFNNNNSLHNIINKTKNKIYDLYANNTSVAISRRKTKAMHLKPESLNDIIDDNQMHNQYECEQYDDIPFVASFEMDKTPKAVICYNGKKYRRKLSDFGWLSKILSSNAVNGFGSVPKLEEWPWSLSLSQHVSDRGYLKKRETELNTFLKECHRTKWIRQLYGYNKVFFAKTDKEWKKLRSNFDKKMIA